MRVLDLTLSTAAENLALDEALLLEAEANRGDEVLRLWEWPEFAVVLGSACRLAEDVDEPACQSDGVPILRRASGGGTVLLGKGCLCFSLVLTYERSPALREVPSSYRFILQRLRDALVGVLPDIELAGTSDLSCGGRKISGNAQHRKRTHLLHHGTLLYSFPLPRIGRYLRMPGRRPDYRGERVHEAFVTNIPESGDELRQRLKVAWQAETFCDEWPQESVQRLVRDKYSQMEWTRRR